MGDINFCYLKNTFLIFLDVCVFVYDLTLMAQI